MTLWTQGPGAQHNTNTAESRKASTLALSLASVAEFTVPKALLGQPCAPVPGAGEKPPGCTVGQGGEKQTGQRTCNEGGWLERASCWFTTTNPSPLKSTIFQVPQNPDCGFYSWGVEGKQESLGPCLHALVLILSLNFLFISSFPSPPPRHSLWTW